MKVFNQILKISIKYKYISATIAFILILTGLFCLKNLDIEAYPDFTSPMVQVITQMPGKSAEEVERLATIPLEKNLNGIPNEKKLYSSSLFGLSVIKVVFEDGLPSSLIRQQVLERIYQTDLPDGVKPVLGPDASAIGEIYRYTLESDYYNPMTLKAIEDWQMEKAFKQVPGIIEVNSFGGPVKTYKVILITTINGIPIRVKDVGQVIIEPAVRIGQVGKNKDNDVIEGIVLMRKGENPTKTIKNRQHKKTLSQIIKIQILYAPKSKFPLFSNSILSQEFYKPTQTVKCDFLCPHPPHFTIVTNTKYPTPLK